MKAKIFSIECLTNMHVGTGDYSLSIVDNEVSKDVNDFTPNINGSGVKGAIRQFFEMEKSDADFIKRAFGGDRIETKNDDGADNKEENKNKDKKDLASEGKLKFLSANLMARPMRTSKGQKPYYLVTTEEIVEKFKNFITTIHSEVEFDKVIINYNELNTVEVENIKVSKRFCFLQKDIYCMSKQQFESVELPVIARNQVKDEERDIRGNLWYEEIVPYNSIFYFYVLSNDGDNDLLEQFAKNIEGKVVQFGANASVGYGYCKVAEIKNVKVTDMEAKK